jgi:pyrimidine-specific ribonucleoside hydrolase
MKKVLFLILTLTLTLTHSLSSHPWKPRHYVIIDTDGGIDDIRAISMLLASPDVRVLAITVSPGAINADAAYLKIRSLLNSFHHEGLPVGINRKSKFISPDFKVALNSKWGVEEGLDPDKAADGLALIKEILSVEKSKISFICLGGMSTIMSAATEIGSFTEMVKEIIWSVDASDIKNGFNYRIDPLAAENILKGKIPVKIVGGEGDQVFYDESLVKSIAAIPTVYAKKIAGSCSGDVAANHSFSKSAYDEMTVLYLHYPQFFAENPKNKVWIVQSEKTEEVIESTLKIISGETVERNQVIKRMPADPSFYFPDVEPSVAAIIEKYGKDEWASGVLANELHRHLGVYAIVGVKMGIRAREYFNTGVDEFSAVSHAGSIPPLSCMNDGIQVSTGATPGHGLLTVLNDPVTIPSVEFTYMNRKIKLTLKPELEKMISSELKEISYVNSLDSDIYWELVRKNSIKYWLNLDRHEIFEIEEIR